MTVIAIAGAEAGDLQWPPKREEHRGQRPGKCRNRPGGKKRAPKWSSRRRAKA